MPERRRPRTEAEDEVELARNPTVKQHYGGLSWQQKRQFREQETLFDDEGASSVQPSPVGATSARVFPADDFFHHVGHRRYKLRGFMERMINLKSQTGSATQSISG